jgi:hypothetical protein
MTKKQKQNEREMNNKSIKQKKCKIKREINKLLLIKIKLFIN